MEGWQDEVFLFPIMLLEKILLGETFITKNYLLLDKLIKKLFSQFSQYKLFQQKEFLVLYNNY